MELGGIGRKRHRIVDRANAYVLFLLSSAIHHKLTISRAHTYTYTHTHTHTYKYTNIKLIKMIISTKNQNETKDNTIKTNKNHYYLF
jgi:hypothetical protein